MKKLLLLFGLLVLFSAAGMANADQYRVNDDQIEALFAQAQVVDLNVTGDFNGFAGMPATLPTTVRSSDKNAAVAFILAFFLGNLGIHRIYLGTKTMTWVGYILTCGGIFGIVPFVDWIVLLVGLIESDISKYVDNPAFFMWL
ncbi:MAG TPA: TM2 domain-containing protein [Bacteroidales bacterium]|nr:TM2 domain-containing protein [Bacteroidales bacterium]